MVNAAEKYAKNAEQLIQSYVSFITASLPQKDVLLLSHSFSLTLFSLFVLPSLSYFQGLENL